MKLQILQFSFSCCGIRAELTVPIIFIIDWSADHFYDDLFFVQPTAQNPKSEDNVCPAVFVFVFVWRSGAAHGERPGAVWYHSQHHEGPLEDGRGGLWVHDPVRPADGGRPCRREGGVCVCVWSEVFIILGFQADFSILWLTLQNVCTTALLLKLFYRRKLMKWGLILEDIGTLIFSQFGVLLYRKSESLPSLTFVAWFYLFISFQNICN